MEDIKFTQGQIVKSKLRTDGNELFLMILHDANPSTMQFNAVVLKDFGRVEEAGVISNSWNYPGFELSDWDEFSSCLKGAVNYSETQYDVENDPVLLKDMGILPVENDR